MQISLETVNKLYLEKQREAVQAEADLRAIAAREEELLAELRALGVASFEQLDHEVATLQAVNDEVLRACYEALLTGRPLEPQKPAEPPRPGSLSLDELLLQGSR